MPLPLPDTAWPPDPLLPFVEQQRRWHAWWRGQPDLLRQDSATGLDPGGRRTFWQRRRSNDQTQATHLVHAPLAGDIATVSADLLFGEPPKLVIPDDQPETVADAGDSAQPTDTSAPSPEVDAAQTRLDELVEQVQLDLRLLEGAEACAATGGVYLRPVWDPQVADHPLVVAVPANYALPVFRFGQLREVTFVETVEETSDGVFWRHLELHRPGVIEHGLYKGTSTNLGDRRSLDAHQATADLQDEVTQHAAVTDGLLVAYVPNMLPNTLNPAQPYGRSDYDGAESLLDALDECWTSWMRDLRMGQARLLVDSSLTQPVRVGRGEARGMDLDKELFVEMNMADSDNKLSEVQFAIRVAEHADTARTLTESIVSKAGYSPQTFGLQIQGAAESGTALRIRENKTFRTQGRKQRYWKPAVEHIAEMLLGLDKVIFNRPTPQIRPQLTWPELQDDPAERAGWINTLVQAEALSIETRVRLAQPELTEQQVTDEVERIKDETGMNAPEPTPAPVVDLTSLAPDQPVLDQKSGPTSEEPSGERA